MIDASEAFSRPRSGPPLRRRGVGHPRRRAPRHLALDHDGAAVAVHLRHGSDVAVVLLASTYVGAEYGGSIPAILIRTPGTNAAAATVIDGYAMKQQGRAGEALGISLYSGFVGGLFGLLVLVLLTEPLSNLALAFTPTVVFRARRARPQRHRDALGRLAGEGPDRRRARADDRDHRHRSGHRRQPLYLRQPRAAVGHPANPGHGRPVRRERAVHADRRAGLGEGATAAPRIKFPEPRDVAAHRQAAGDRIGDGHVRGHHAGRRRRRSPPSSPTTRRRRWSRHRRSSATARRKASPRRKRPTTPSHAPRSSRC